MSQKRGREFKKSENLTEKIIESNQEVTAHYETQKSIVCTYNDPHPYNPSHSSLNNYNNILTNNNLNIYCIDYFFILKTYKSSSITRLVDYFSDSVVQYARDQSKLALSKSILSSIQHALHCFCCNLARATKRGAKKMVISLDKNNYLSSKIIINGSPLNSWKNKEKPPSYRHMRLVLSSLEAVGLITIQLGKFDKKGEGKMTTLFLSEEIQEIIKRSISYTEQDTLGLDNVLVLRDDTGKDLQFKLNNALKSQITDITRWNELLLGTNITVGGSELDVQLKRIYKGDFKSYGRIYAHNGGFQTLPADVRNDIMMNGSPTVELDMSSLHPRICYTLQGIQLPKDYDCYGVDISDLGYIGEPDEVRSILKLCMMALINAKDGQNPVNIVAKKLLEDSKRVNRRFKSLVKNFPVSSLIKRLDEEHYRISPYMCSNSAGMLQYLDSEIMSLLLNKCTINNIPILPLHDGTRCKLPHQAVVKRMMESAYEAVLGDATNCVVNIK